MGTAYSGDDIAADQTQGTSMRGSLWMCPYCSVMVGSESDGPPGAASGVECKKACPACTNEVAPDDWQKFVLS